MIKLVASVCIVLVVFTPLRVMAADGAVVAKPVAGDVPTFRPFSNTEVITTSPLAPVVGYGVFMTGAVPGEFTGYIATADNSANVRSHNGIIYTEDGYALQARLVRHDAEVARVQLIARGPDGRTAEAMLVAMKGRNTVETPGISEVRELLGRSKQFSLLRAVVPNFVHAPSTSRAFRVGTNDACTGDQLAMFGATLAVLGTCGSVEATGDVLGCIGAIVALIGTMVSVYDSCGGVLDVCGSSPCPTPEAPPCTSYTIC